MSQEKLMNVLVGPHVSEKSARISEGANQFVFRVRRDATKTDIKAAVELMFEVKVQDVNVVNVGGKQKRFGQRLGRRQDFKKAYVRLAPGQTLDEALSKRIATAIRQNTTPRHVPERIVQVADIPRTKSGKIVELAVRQVIHGREVKNREALANPEALDLYRDLPQLR